MGIIITSLVLLVIGIIMVLAYVNSRSAPEGILIFGVMIAVISVIVLGVSIGCVIDTNINGDLYYQNKLHEREMLEYRINQLENNNIGNELLYNDIVEFNNDLRGVKKWADNFWIGSFYVQEIAQLDYIEVR